MEVSRASHLDGSNNSVFECSTGDFQITNWMIGYVTMLYILMVPIITGNVLTIVAVFNFKHKQTPSDIFVASLALSDLLVGMVTVPMDSVGYLRKGVNCNAYICITRFVVISISFAASMINLTAVSIERYIAVLHPLRYHSLVTVSRARVVTILIWISTLLFICSSHSVWAPELTSPSSGKHVLCDVNL